MLCPLVFHATFDVSSCVGCWSVSWFFLFYVEVISKLCGVIHSLLHMYEGLQKKDEGTCLWSFFMALSLLRFLSDGLLGVCGRGHVWSLDFLLGCRGNKGLPLSVHLRQEELRVCMSASLRRNEFSFRLSFSLFLLFLSFPLLHSYLAQSSNFLSAPWLKKEKNRKLLLSRAAL